jgi:hypothetical protein
MAHERSFHKLIFSRKFKAEFVRRNNIPSFCKARKKLVLQFFKTKIQNFFIEFLLEIRSEMYNAAFMKAVLLTTIFTVTFYSVNCEEIIRRLEESSPRDDPDQKQVESIRTSSRSVYRIRPFRKSQVEKTETVTSNEDDLSNDKPTKVWIPGGLEFSCKGRNPGYYSDPSPVSKCQVRLTIFLLC